MKGTRIDIAARAAGKNNENARKLTVIEARLVDDYRSLPPKDKEIVREYAHFLRQREEEAKNKIVKMDERKRDGEQGHEKK